MRSKFGLTNVLLFLALVTYTLDCNAAVAKQPILDESFVRIRSIRRRGHL